VKDFLDWGRDFRVLVPGRPHAAGGDDRVPELSDAASSPVCPPLTVAFPLLLASGEDISGLTPSFSFFAGLGTLVVFFLGATSTVGPSSSSFFCNEILACRMIADRSLDPYLLLLRAAAEFGFNNQLLVDIDTGDRGL
jgi:hypothetical protein